LDTIALVTLVRATGTESRQENEMIEEIREVLESSKLSKTWTVEKITVLQAPEAVAE